MDASIAKREDEEYFNTVDELKQIMPRCVFCGESSLGLYRFWDEEQGEEVNACCQCIRDKLEAMSIEELYDFWLEKFKLLPAPEAYYVKSVLADLAGDEMQHFFEVVR